jgi:hypothetical protein
MFFLAETTFIFGSWICEVDGDGKLHSRLLIDSRPHGDLADSTIAADQLTEEFSQLATSKLTQIS